MPVTPWRRGSKLQNKLTDLEDRKRYSNVKFRGVPASVSSVEIQGYLIRLTHKVLPDVPEHDLKTDRAHRLPHPNFLNKSILRDIIACIHYYSTKEAPMTAAGKLKTLPSPYSDVHLYIDLSQAGHNGSKTRFCRN
ncbi:hypothetical protein GDO78_016750 [Eleutherodactylus coqui]|uniref:Uncharacterized protein n=1 Tax=Eleutherodactylus coqui TaxID=57060 RepID=A0A8J6BJY4_ELECQ|nr:hypothetical protein GDO78_016750 [Eleutherodactylus coqui]